MTAVADCMHHMQPKIHFPKSHFDTNGNILLHSFTIKHEVLKEGDATSYYKSISACMIMCKTKKE